MPTIKSSHHRKDGFANSDQSVVIGNFPWYEMFWRSVRGDFKPMAPPEGGYDTFARDWSVQVDRKRIATRQQAPVVTWLGHVTILLQIAGLNILMDPTLADFAGPYGSFGSARRVPVPLQPEDLPSIDIVRLPTTITTICAAPPSGDCWLPDKRRSSLCRWG